MKRFKLIGLLAGALIVALAIFSAFQFGEKSPLYAKGIISVDPPLIPKVGAPAALFLVFYDANNPTPMPYGAMRIAMTKSEVEAHSFEYAVTQERLMVMGQQKRIPHFFRIKARLDQDGQGGPDQPGDLTGEADMVAMGSETANITINKFIE